VRGGIGVTVTAWRTSWSVNTLQEQTIMDSAQEEDERAVLLGKSIFKMPHLCKRKNCNFNVFQTATDDGVGCGVNTRIRG